MFFKGFAFFLFSIIFHLNLSGQHSCLITTVDGTCKVYFDAVERDDCDYIKIIWTGKSQSGLGYGRGDLTVSFLGQEIFSRYTGDLKNGKMEGFGILIIDDSEKYIGRFRNGEFHGRGTLIDKDEGVMADCEWYNGEVAKIYGVKPAPASEIRSLSIDKYKSLFSAKPRERKLPVFKDNHCQGDCYGGYGTYRFDNGDSYAGHWKHGWFHGKGSYQSNDEIELNGNWEYGELKGRCYLKTEKGKKIYATLGDGIRLEGNDPEYTDRIYFTVMRTQCKFSLYGKYLADNIRLNSSGDKVYVGDVFEEFNMNLEHFQQVFTKQFYRDYYVEYNSKFRDEVPEYISGVDVTNYRIEMRSLTDVVEEWNYKNKKIFRCLLDMENAEFNNSVQLYTITYSQGFASPRLEFNFLGFFVHGMEEDLAIIDLDTFQYMNF